MPQIEFHPKRACMQNYMYISFNPLSCLLNQSVSIHCRTIVQPSRQRHLVTLSLFECKHSQVVYDPLHQAFNEVMLFPCVYSGVQQHRLSPAHMKGTYRVLFQFFPSTEPSQHIGYPADVLALWERVGVVWHPLSSFVNYMFIQFS